MSVKIYGLRKREITIAAVLEKLERVYPLGCSIGNTPHPSGGKVHTVSLPKVGRVISVADTVSGAFLVHIDDDNCIKRFEEIFPKAEFLTDNPDPLDPDVLKKIQEFQVS